MQPGAQGVEPCSESVTLAIEMDDAASRTVDEQSTNVGVSTLADTQQMRFPTGRVLRWSKTEPCGHVPCFLELLAVADRRD